MEKLAGSVAFITGAAQGIGLGLARAFALEGMKLALADIDSEALGAAQAELSGLTPVETFVLDVRDRAAYARVADEAEARLGAVSLLCNNAGVGGALFDLSDMRYELWDYVVGINLGGVISGVQNFLPRMLERGTAGHIVNTSSAAGLAMHPERTSGYTYATSKYAVTGLSEALHYELAAAAQPIGVSVLFPGMVATSVASHTLAHAPLAQASREQRTAWSDIAARGDAGLSRFGMDPDAVGERVVRAVKANELYIHTDRLMEHPLQARTRALLEAMPTATSVYDEALGQAMKGQAMKGQAMKASRGQ